MKHKFIVAVAVVIALFAAGCSGSRPAILPSELGDTEKELLNALGISDYAAYDVNVEGMNIKELRLWADYYREGELKGMLFDSTSKIPPSGDGNMRLLFSAFSPKPGTDEETWVVSLGPVRFTKYLTRPKMNLGTRFSSFNGEREIEKGQPIILAVFVSGESITPVKQEVFEWNMEAFKEMIQNDHVYILYCSFK